MPEALQIHDQRVVASGMLQVTSQWGPAAPNPSKTTPSGQWNEPPASLNLEALGPTRRATTTTTGYPMARQAWGSHGRSGPDKKDPSPASTSRWSTGDDQKMPASTPARRRPVEQATDKSVTTVERNPKRPRTAVSIAAPLDAVYKDKLGMLVSEAVEHLNQSQ